MAEERFCPHCGRSNPRTMPRCINCGQRIIKGGVSRERESAGGSLLLEEEETTTDAAHSPWWRTDANSSIPPPPQVREELARAESKQRDLERIAEQERLFQERLKLHEASRERLKAERRAPSWEPKSPASGAGNCWRCGKAMGEAGATFSFCLNCGADASAAGRGAGTGTQGRFTSAAAPGYSSAFQTTQQQQQRTQQQTTINPNVAQTSVNPVAAALFSFFIPGIGQFMNGQTAKGFLLLLASIVFGVITVAVPVSGLIRLGVSIIAAIDAYRVAERRREGKHVRREEWDLG